MEIGSPAMRMIEKYTISLNPPEFMGLKKSSNIFIFHIAGLPDHFHQLCGVGSFVF